MISIWIMGIVMIILGFIAGVQKVVKVLRYGGKTEGFIINTRIAGTSRSGQPIRVRYKYYIDGKEYIGKSEWLNNGIFYPGKPCDIRYDLNRPQKSYMKSFDRVIQTIIGMISLIMGIGVIWLGYFLSSMI